MPEESIVSVAMTDYLARRAQLQEKLKAQGVDCDNLDDLVENIEEYHAIQLNVIDARQEQFKDDAYDMLVGFRSYTQKNSDHVTRFLRKFAEHVVWNALDALDIQDAPRSTADIVDRIPQMSQEEE